MRFIGTDVPAQHGFQIGDAVDATGPALTTNNQNAQDRCNRLRNDGEVHITHTALEHRDADNESQNHGYSQHQQESQWQALEGQPDGWQLSDLVPVHEVRNTGGGLNLGADRVGGFKLQKHGHAITTKTEEHALSQRQNAAIAPAQHQSDCYESVGQILAHHIETEAV